MDYCLNTGDGAASIWTGHPDIDLTGDGLLDGVRTDLDGDGLFDDAFGDGDGDGSGDYAILDVDDDGTPETRYTDDGTGTWTVSGGAPGGPLRWLGLDGTEHTGDGDINGGGDINGDGVADRFLDTDSDGRWDVTLTDVDGNGSADSASAL